MTVRSRQLTFGFVPDTWRDEAAPRLVSDVPFAEVARLPPFGEIEHGELFSLSLTNDTAPLTHGLHRFPAKFIPQVPAWALEQFASQGTWVVDPFMGSGTTLVEALRFDVRAMGLDIDPLARLIASAKTNPPPSDALVSHGAVVLEAARHRRIRELIVPMRGVQQFEHWYAREAWRRLQALREAILDVDCDERSRCFLMVIFSSILRWVSNADDQSMKTYVSGTNRKRPPEVFETFGRALRRAVHRVREFEAARRGGAVARIPADGSATAFGLPDGTAHLIVTSPPYLDSVDYMYNFMLEYFWLGDILGVPDRATFNGLRRKYIGAKLPEEADPLPAALVGVAGVEDMRGARRRAAETYFAKMDKHFAEAGRALRVGGRYVLVIGNSQTRSSILPVHDCLARLAAGRGLQIERAFAYRVRRHYMKFPRRGRGGIILIDWVIVMRRVQRNARVPDRLPLPWVTLGRRAVAN